MPSPNIRGTSLRHTITLSPVLSDALACRCAAHDITPSEAVRLALADWLDLDAACVEMGKRGRKPAKTKAEKKSRKSSKKV